MVKVTQNITTCQLEVAKGNAHVLLDDDVPDTILQKLGLSREDKEMWLVKKSDLVGKINACQTLQNTMLSDPLRSILSILMLEGHLVAMNSGEGPYQDLLEKDT